MKYTKLWGVLSSAWARMRHGSVFRSNFMISSRKDHCSSCQSPSILQFRIIRASSLATFNDAMEQERSRTGSFSRVAIFFSFRIRVYDVLGSVSCVSPNLASKKRLYSGITIGKLYEKCHTIRVSLSRSFRFSQQSISLQLSGTSQLPCLHCHFQLISCVSNLDNFQQAVSLFTIYTAPRQLVPEVSEFG